jgi:hypothetical protein
MVAINLDFVPGTSVRKLAFRRKVGQLQEQTREPNFLRLVIVVRQMRNQLGIDFPEQDIFR